VVGAISSGDHHTCARLREPASIKCWGDNHGGQLGLGNTQFIGDEADEMAELSSVDLGAGAPATNVSAGYAHTCAVLTDGAVKCWGNNDYGQLGIGDTRRRGDGQNELGDNLKAVELGARLGALSVVTGGSHTCAIRSDHRVTCWGANTFGQLGLGDTNHRGDGSDELGIELPPIDVGDSVGQVVAGDFHTCVLLSGGSVKCWGYGLYGQLGQGSSENIGDDPGELEALPAIDLGRGRTARELASGGYHVCAVLDDDSVKCWGANSYGQLGLGDIEHRGDEPGEMGDALPNVDLIFR